jgi:hypothetical protein
MMITFVILKRNVIAFDNGVHQVKLPQTFSFLENQILQVAMGLFSPNLFSLVFLIPSNV